MTKITKTYYKLFLFFMYQIKDAGKPPYIAIADPIIGYHSYRYPSIIHNGKRKQQIPKPKTGKR
jgi:hypothetical protein|tara:strand:- start:1285 stop:1476 length:192 start_codon:yes stop_codon:yes gene_type:complete